jgi:hypothetical protein
MHGLQIGLWQICPVLTCLMAVVLLLMGVPEVVQMAGLGYSFCLIVQIEMLW